MKVRSCSTASAHFHTPLDARRHGIETVYQDLAVAPQLNIMENIFLGREIRRPGIFGSVFRMLDKKRMMNDTVRYMADLKIGIRAMDQGLARSPAASARV